MGEKKKRQNDAAEIDALYRQIEHAKNEDIAIKAIEIARYWLNKADRQTAQIQNLERRNNGGKDLPSAQQWIPCSERLPDEDLWTGTGKQFSNSVLMTVYDKNDEDTIVDYGHTTDGEWYSETADEYVESIADWKVIAWMPLPLPYKGEQE